MSIKYYEFVSVFLL